MTNLLVGVVIVAVLIYLGTEFLKKHDFPTNEEEYEFKEAEGDFE